MKKLTKTELLNEIIANIKYYSDPTNNSEFNEDTDLRAFIEDCIDLAYNTYDIEDEL